MRNLAVRSSLLAAVVCLVVPATFGQGQVNGSGATLFVDFFTRPGFTTDFIDVDGDGVYGPIDINMDGVPDFADQLSNSSENSWNNVGDDQFTQTWWLFQYRSVGSVRGFDEFLGWQACQDLPEDIPSELGVLNRQVWAETGELVGTFDRCEDDTDGDGEANGSGTPICPTSMDFANTDVEGAWAVQGASGTPAWNAHPVSPGYGQNMLTSNAGQDNLLPSLTQTCDDGDVTLNLNTDNPDGQTIFGSGLAYSPVTIIANRGANVSTISFSEANHLWVTGRLPNGENLAGATRDVGSGTRNAAMNSLGIDPAWGMGDHVGLRVDTSDFTNLGPRHQPSNCGGSSIMENAVQNRRNAVGYTGMVGGSRSLFDALGGRYEILGVIKDVAGGTNPVRPTVESVLFNLDVNTGWQIGGIQTFSTVGNPRAALDPDDTIFADPNSPLFGQYATFGAPGDPAPVNGNVSDFINNITLSIAAFEQSIGDPNETANMPADLLATEFFLTAVCEALPRSTDPADYVANTVNADLVLTFLNETGIPNTVGYGVVTPAGLVPTRQVPKDPNDPNAVYSDGLAGDTYRYNDNGTLRFIGAGAELSESNAVAGDFNQDGARNADDIPAMIAAVADPANFDSTPNGGDRGNMAVDVVIPEVIGDLNGDGDFDKKDVRYMADGHAMVAAPNPGVGTMLNRAMGFGLADDEDPNNNYFGTQVVRADGDAVPYGRGVSRFDLVGNPDGPTPGAAPVGHDGVVDEDDYCYIWANAGDWQDIDSAAEITEFLGMVNRKDLSADHTGDLVVDQLDAEAFVSEAWGACLGDLDFADGVQLSDLSVLLGNFGGDVDPGMSGYMQGDLDCDGQVGLSDLSLLLARFGSSDC